MGWIPSWRGFDPDDDPDPTELVPLDYSGLSPGWDDPVEVEVRRRDARAKFEELLAEGVEIVFV